MRVFVIVLTIVICASMLSLYLLPPSFVSNLEDMAEVDLGIFARASETSKTDSESPFGEGGFDEKITYELVVKNDTFSTSFIKDLENKIKENSAMKEEVIDYYAFAYNDDFKGVNCTVDYKELAYIFSRVLISSTDEIPVYGKLQRVIFEKNENNFTIQGEIEVCFERMIKEYALEFLPESAKFYLCVPINVNNSKLSVNYEKTILECTNFFLPKSLLLLGCKVAFAGKDVQSIFGNALINMLIKTGFYN